MSHILLSYRLDKNSISSQNEAMNKKKLKINVFDNLILSFLLFLKGFYSVSFLFPYSTSPCQKFMPPATLVTSNPCALKN